LVPPRSIIDRLTEIGDIYIQVPNELALSSLN
jgi:hypothetical protein